MRNVINHALMAAAWLLTYICQRYDFRIYKIAGREPQGYDSSYFVSVFVHIMAQKCLFFIIKTASKKSSIRWKNKVERPFFILSWRPFLSFPSSKHSFRVVKGLLLHAESYAFACSSWCFYTLKAMLSAVFFDVSECFRRALAPWFYINDWLSVACCFGLNHPNAWLICEQKNLDAK